MSDKITGNKVDAPLVKLTSSLGLKNVNAIVDTADSAAQAKASAKAAKESEIISGKNAITAINAAENAAEEASTTTAKLAAEKAAEKAAEEASKEFDQLFQDRFSLVSPIPWQPRTEVTNPLQVYSHIEAGVESVYQPDPKLVPFTTGATFNDDRAKFGIANLVNVTQMRIASASQIGYVYDRDYTIGMAIANGGMTAKSAYWHNGQFYSVGTDTGFTSNDFDADLAAGRFISEGLVTVSSIGIFIADNTGTSDVSDALFLSNTKNNVTIQRGTYRIATDTHINANTKYKFERGAMIVVDAGITLTWDAEIEAGWYQIFGLTGIIKPTNRVHNTPIEHRYIGSVKTTWFGVINDGVFPTNYKDPSIPSPVDGQMPTGTDSTLAFKRAFAFCQYASYKNGHYVVQFERVTLEFEPGSQIILKGSNLFNEQIYLTELDALEVEANVDGGDFLAIPEYQKVGVFNVTIGGGNATIMWRPENENQVFANVRQLISNFEIEGGLSLVPVGVTAAQWINGYGYFLTNKSLVQKGGTSDEYFNSLSYQQFTRLNVMLPSIGLPQSAVSTEGAFKWLFGYLGYSLGDRLHLKECKFNGFDKVVYCQNPESVEFNATGCSFRSKRNNATFFHYLSFYGQFRVEGCGIFMKGENQTFIHADDSAGVSRFIDTAEFTAINNRMETGNNNKVTLIKGEYGRFILSQLNPNYGSNGITTDSIGVHLEKGASAILENVNVPTTSELYQIAPANKFPLWFKHCNFYARDNIDSITYSDNGVTYKSYKFAMAQGDNVPAVIFENCPVYTQSDNIIDAPRIYGGRGVLAADVESAELKKRDGQGYERINGKSFIMPRYCVVTQMRLQIKAMTGTFADSVKVSFGDLVKTHAITGGVANDIELLTTPISMPDPDESGRTILIEYQKSGVTVSDGSPGIATIRYRCSQGRTELTGDNAYEPWL